MNDRSTTLTDRIAFAERWLGRARRQLEDGRVAHGALAMMLAEAELHRAREVGVRPAGEGPRHGWRPAAVLLAASAVAGVGVALALARPSPQPEPLAGGPSILTLGGTGDVLRMVSASEPAVAPEVVERVIERVVERTVVKSIVVRLPAPAVGGAPDRPMPPVRQPVRVASGAPKGSPAAPAVVQSAAPAVAAVPPVPAPAVTEADVIELVLAAERSLRRSPNQ